MKLIENWKLKRLYKQTTSVSLGDFICSIPALVESPEYAVDTLHKVCARIALDHGYTDLEPGRDKYYLNNYRSLNFERAAEVLNHSMQNVLRHIPEDSGLYYRLRDHTDLHRIVNNVIAPFCKSESKRLFPKLYEKLADNLEAKKFVHPRDYPGDDVVEAYLKGTPLIHLFDTPVALDIPKQSLFEHMHVVGGSGAGKTQWLSQHILRLSRDQESSIVVVDSQGDLLPKLRTLESIQDRVVYINPRYPPSIRLFGEGSPEIFDYLFSGILGADLTTKQGVFFKMMAKLLQSIPGATIMDMFHMMNDIKPYQKHIAKLPDLQRLFFQQDFNSKTFQPTKEQVRYRLNALLENKTLQLLLGESTTPLNLEKALNEGAVILVDTSKEHLKSSSAAFGRIFIALILQAIYNRASQKERRPTFLIIDEAQEYFDENIDDLLTQVRKYKCGCVFAHQYLGQCSPQLRESLAANTSIKMVSGVSAPDARSLAPELRTTADFILSQKPLSFATYVRNVTEKAVSIQVTTGLLDKEKHVQLKPQHTPPPERIHTPPSQDDISTDASQTW